MGKKLIYLCSTNYLSSKSFFIKWIDEIKDEVIVFIDSVKLIKIFSSICPHFGGTISYDSTKKNLFCYWHGLKFSIEGKCTNNKNFKSCLKNYDFELKDNYIYIKK